jgi:hypothetical protein
MRLLGVPRLPLPELIPSSVLARNRPGPADSFSPSVPLTYAPSLPITNRRCLSPQPKRYRQQSQRKWRRCCVDGNSATGVTEQLRYNLPFGKLSSLMRNVL